MSFPSWFLLRKSLNLNYNFHANDYEVIGSWKILLTFAILKGFPIVFNFNNKSPSMPVKGLGYRVWNIIM